MKIYRYTKRERGLWLPWHDPFMEYDMADLRVLLLYTEHQTPVPKYARIGGRLVHALDTSLGVWDALNTFRENPVTCH